MGPEITAIRARGRRVRLDNPTSMSSRMVYRRRLGVEPGGEEAGCNATAFIGAHDADGARATGASLFPSAILASSVKNNKIQVSKTRYPEAIFQ